MENFELYTSNKAIREGRKKSLRLSIATLCVKRMPDKNADINEKRELCELIQTKGTWETKITAVEAKRIQKDWARHMRYKMTLSNGKSFLGNAQSLWWVINLIWTDFRYPAAAKVSEIYYECWQHLMPVEFVSREEVNSVIVIFRAKGSEENT